MACTFKKLKHFQGLEVRWYRLSSQIDKCTRWFQVKWWMPELKQNMVVDDGVFSYQIQVAKDDHSNKVRPD